MTKRIQALICAAAAALATGASAATIHTAQDGSLCDGKTYVGGALPLPTDDVVVQHLTTMDACSTLTYHSLTFSARATDAGGRLDVSSGTKVLTLVAGLIQSGTWGPDPYTSYALAYCFRVSGGSLEVNGDVTIHGQGGLCESPGKMKVNGDVLYTGRDNIHRIAATGLDGISPSSGEYEVSGALRSTAGIDLTIPNLFSAATTSGKITVGGELDGRLGVALAIVNGGEDGGGGLYLQSWDQIVGPHAVVAGNAGDSQDGGVSRFHVYFPDGRHSVGRSGSGDAGLLSFPVQLGHGDTGKSLADYAPQVFDSTGAAVDMKGASWVETAHGGYRMTVPAYDGRGVGSYHIVLTADARQWFAGTIPILAQPLSASAVRGAIGTVSSSAAAAAAAVAKINDTATYAEHTQDILIQMTEQQPGQDQEFLRRLTAAAVANVSCGPQAKPALVPHPGGATEIPLPTR
jgi:hypothetical protein